VWLFTINIEPARTSGSVTNLSDESMENMMMNFKTLTAVCMLGLMSGFTYADDMAEKDGMMKDNMESTMSDHDMKKDDMSDDMGHGMKEDGMMDEGMEGDMKEDKMMSDDTMAQ